MTRAERVVRARLAGGPIGFDAFMDLALYDPAVGFYSSAGRAGGRTGDFITSPETGPLFGLLVGRYLDRIWHDLGRPDEFTFVDAGAGPATLARTILAADPECRDSLRVVCIEASAEQRASHPDGVESRADLPDQPVTGVIFANELLDNLPFRIAEFDGDRWRELLVADDGADLIFERADLDESAQHRCELLVPDPTLGTRVPLADRACAFVADATARLERGRLVVLDYGASTSDLAGRAAHGWLRTYRGHDRGAGPLDAVGEQDITADVPFDQLPTPDRKRTQADWLANLGIDGLVDEGRRIWTERAGVGDLDALKARSRIGEAGALTDPTGLGGFGVLEWAVG